MSSCAIVQSSYIPWRGYFDLIRKVDSFVFLDSVQFTKRDWRTRNKVKTPQGSRWLTVPVVAKNHFELSIRDVCIDNSQAWGKKHLKTIEQSYAKLPAIKDVLSILESSLLSPPSMLHQLNRNLTTALWKYASGDTAKIFHGDEVFEIDPKMDANKRLISICLKLGAELYLSGPSAKAYMDLEEWKDNGITVEFINYNYQSYPQLYGEFDSYISVVEPLAQFGRNSFLNFLPEC